MSNMASMTVRAITFSDSGCNEINNVMTFYIQLIKLVIQLRVRLKKCVNSKPEHRMQGKLKNNFESFLKKTLINRK